MLVAPDEPRAGCGRPSSGPAERAPGLAFEPGLVDRILDDAGAEPGQLPLVESLLTDLWDRREGGYLTLRGYEAAGGVAGAVAEHAERTARRPSAGGRRRRLRAAVHRAGRPGTGARRRRFVRRPVRSRELRPPSATSCRRSPRAAAGRRPGRRDAGARRRRARPPGADRPLAAAAHWLAEDRDFLAWRTRSDTQRERWEADDRPTTALLRGAALAGGRRLAARARRRPWPRQTSTTCAAAGRGSAARCGAGGSSPRCWRCWRLAAGDAGGGRGRRRQALADQLAAANANALGREALARMPADSAPAAQLALAAWRSDPTSPQARTALATSFFALRSADAELLNVAPATVTGLTSAGDTVVVGGMPHLVALTGTSGPAPRRLELPDITSGELVALSPDGRRLAYTIPDHTEIRLREITGTAEPTTLPNQPVTPGTTVGSLSFAPDGERLGWITVDATNTVRMTVWDLRSDAEIPNGLGALAPDATAAWLTPDPNVVLMRYGKENAPETRLVRRSLVDGTEVATMPAGAVVAGTGTRVVSCEDGGDKPRRRSGSVRESGNNDQLVSLRRRHRRRVGRAGHAAVRLRVPARRRRGRSAGGSRRRDHDRHTGHGAA